MTTKHTPGPWVRRDNNGSGDCWNAAVYAADGSCVVTFDVASAERDGDADLVAAGPDLLAACKAALEGLTNAATCDEVDGPEFKQREVARGLLRAAIHKAEGRTT